MRFENCERFLPASVVEVALVIQAVDGRSRHEEGVVCIVVNEESLTPKAEQPVDSSQPLLDSREIFIVSPAVNRIGSGEPSRRDL